MLSLKCNLLTFLFCIQICINNAKQTNGAKNNVLVILIDDLRHLSLKSVSLPNIHELANRGVNFKNAFAQQALCAPSRNSLLTGRRPDSLRLYDFYNYWRDTVANFTTLPQFFKENGYDTFSVGKVFHPGLSSNFSDDYPYSWSHHPYHPPSEIYKDAPVCKDTLSQKLQSNLVCPVTVHKQPGKTLPDLESLDYAIDILKNRRNDSKPFFLAVGFHKPHIPIKFPRDFLYSVPISTILPPKHPHIPKKLPLVAWHSWTDVRRRDDIRRLNISLPFGTMPQKWTLKIRQSYFAAAMYIDTLVGVLMSNVDTSNTIVVFTSDHGWSLGENGLWAKYSNFDVALRVPLIFIAPKLRRSEISTPVELIDIFPTVVDLAGLKKNIPKCTNKSDKSLLWFEGNSLVPIMDKDGSKVKDAFAISQYPRPSEYPQGDSDKPRLKNIKIMGYSIRTNRYRYTEWASFNNTSFKINWNKQYGVELYDHLTDPDESDNKIYVFKYNNIKNKLSKMLRTKVDPKY